MILFVIFKYLKNIVFWRNIFSPIFLGDDDNNNEECGWDGGDCCGDDIKTGKFFPKIELFVKCLLFSKICLHFDRLLQ